MIFARTGRDWWPNVIALLVAALVLGLAGWIIFCLIGGPGTIASATSKAIAAYQGLTDSQATVEQFGKLMTPLGVLIAAPVGLLGVILAFWRTVIQHKDSLQTTRKTDAEIFAKAVEHLGADKTSVRIGAALALENLARSSPGLLSQVIEILCAYIRDSRPIQEPAASDKSPSAPPSLTERQLILEIIIRLRDLDPEKRIPIDLHGADLAKAKLTGANLSKADLNWSNLSMASLAKANLNNANLFHADVTGAVFAYAAMENIELADAIGLNTAKGLPAHLKPPPGG